MLISHLRNIISLNEKFAYNLVGKIREAILPFFDSNLSYQERKTSKKITDKIILYKNALDKILPSFNGSELQMYTTLEEQEKIINIADKALLLEFNILSQEVKFNKEINWHIDFSSGFVWEKNKLYKKYLQVSTDNNADVKFPRELSRCHHFLYLGQAYLLTQDEKYTKEFINQIKSWIKENPYKKSINWCCSMDIGIRASNWIYSIQMFKDSKLFNDEVLIEILTSLYLHGRYIYENPEKNRVYNHNHYLSDLASQILLSLLFGDKNNTESKLWFDNGLYEFFREIRLQILPSGFSYERTTNYHRLVTELISYTIIILKNNNVEVPQDIDFRVKKMFEVIVNYTFSNGNAPIIGDQDNGRYLPFFPLNVNYQEYLICIGATLYHDQHLKYFSKTNNTDLLFLFGKEGIIKYNKLEATPKELLSKAYSDAGFYILRSKRVYLFINNSGLSHYNENIGLGTHTHSDLLSFVYSYNGVNFLVDPGTYVYSSSPKERMKFRSTKMHNTITIDDFDQNNLVEKDLWSIERNAVPQERLWLVNAEESIFEGSHTGYTRLKDPVLHTRRFELNENNLLKVIDKLKCKGKHEVKCHFHFDEGVKISISNKTLFCEKGSQKITIDFNYKFDYNISLEKEYISKAYNSKVLAPYIILAFKIDGNAEFTTTIQKKIDD